MADKGYTHMPVGGAELEPLVAIPVHRVVRIEPFIDELKARDLASLDDFAGALVQRLDQAAADPPTIAFKPGSPTAPGSTSPTRPGTT